MAGIKRKDPAPKADSFDTRKKSKVEPKKSKAEPKKGAAKKGPRIELEAETDSDPIVESDTTEHSGDDDGVSWPSDDDDGGVPVAPAKKQQPAKALPARAKKNAPAATTPPAKGSKLASKPSSDPPSKGKPDSKLNVFAL